MKLSTLMTAGLLSAAIAVPAYAAANQSPANDGETQAIAAVKVSATDAIANVLKQAKGKVVELDLDTLNGVPGYEVTVVDPAGVESNYLVDGISGAVTLSADNGHNDNAAEGEDDDKGQPQGASKG
ncbi:MAG TPA: PepSY domain-containing protein [Devosia sp.]|nr:PepSY domain-containing protein [Devosia sp.]